MYFEHPAKMAIAYVYQTDGEQSKYNFEATPHNIAHFIGRPEHMLCEKIIITDMLDRAILSTNMWYIDRCPDQTLCSEIVEILAPIQIGEVAVEEITYFTEETVKEQSAKQFTLCINGPLRVGDLVLSTADDDFVPCLVGVVKQIDFLGTPQHETENDADDVHVDFTGDYSVQRQKDIARHYGQIFGVDRPYEEVAHDDVIMAPDCLLNITGISEDKLKWIMESEQNAIIYAYRAIRQLLNEKSLRVPLPDGRTLIATEKGSLDDYPGIQVLLEQPGQTSPVDIVLWAEYNTDRDFYPQEERLRSFLWKSGEDDFVMNMSYDTGKLVHD